MFKNLIVVASLILVLTGCATKWDVSLNQSDNDAIKNGQTKSAEIVKSKVEGISSLKVKEDATETEEALFSVIKAISIAGIETPYFKVKKARLNTDNADKALSTVAGGIPIVSMMKVSTTSIENDRGTTELYSEGGDISMKDSLNRTEVHSVANDGSTANTTSIVDSSSTIVPEEIEEVEIDERL